MVETVIDATIVVSQESQKGMVIGKGGAKIKEVGIKARVVRDREGGREGERKKEYEKKANCCRKPRLEARSGHWPTVGRGVCVILSRSFLTESLKKISPYLRL